MTTVLPSDANDNAIPALRLKDGGAHTISATTANSVRNIQAFAPDTKIISIFSTENSVYLKFGESAVVTTTNDHYFPGGVYYDVAIGGYGVDHTPFLSILAAEADCSVYISEKI